LFVVSGQLTESLTDPGGNAGLEEAVADNHECGNQEDSRITESGCRFCRSENTAKHKRQQAEQCDQIEPRPIAHEERDHDDQNG